MQHPGPPPEPPAGTNAAHAPRQTNNGANLLSQPLKRLSLHTATNTPLPRSPGLDSPKRSTESRRSPSSPIPPLSVRRSASVASLNRPQSPAMGRKSSTSSLRDTTPGTPRAALSRRSSLNPNMASPAAPKSPLATPLEEKAPLRACDVAEEHFKKELARHEDSTETKNAGTIVIVHDQCYGHRFARPKTSKSTLSFIMERPERILASVLGISAAYVRLGDHHAEGSHPPHPDHEPSGHIPFKIRKTSRLVDITSPVVTNVHGTRWMSELKSLCDNAERKLATTGKELARDAPSVPGEAKKRELHAGDLYLCSESMNAFQGALGGVLDAVDAVFEDNKLSRAFVCIRPPGHHCSDDYPSGFCWLNNVHVGIEHAMMQYGLTHAAIIDFDLHHGDGSQAITWARNKKVQNMSKNTPNWKKTSIGYFSLHDINSYPCEEGDDDKVQAASLCIENAHGQSIWNVHLQPWKTPEEFWAIYEEKYMILLEKTRLYLKHHTNRLSTSPNHPKPKAAIFLSAGFDASEWETAGMQRHAVNVPTEFYARFTRDVVRLAEEEGTSVKGRVISVLEGGYSDRALCSGVLSHLSGLCDGQVWTDPKPSHGLALDMSQRLGGLSISEDEPMTSVESESTPVAYDPSWWHSTQLSELENLVNPPPVAAPKKPRTTGPAHFFSPTQSFTAKVVDPSKISRTVSGKYATSSSPTFIPPPPVDWATATHALSKLLIPSDRQTRSYKPEELAETKVKKEKAVAVAPPTAQAEPSGRQLRGRKGVTSYVEPDSDDEKATRAESRANRRKTIADFPLVSAEPLAPTRTASRRMSIASSVSSIGEKTTSRTTSTTTSRRSVAPSTTTATGPMVKKTRAPASTTNPRAPTRPPVPRLPSDYKGKTTAAKGKENDDVDALTTGLKRITLKMPSREEYEAREKEKEEKQKALEAAKKTATKTTTRKTPAARASTSKTTTKPATTTKPTAAKRAPGRPSKSSKAESPVDNAAPPTVAQAPTLQRAATDPVQQAPPVQPDTDALLKLAVLSHTISESFVHDHRPSLGSIDPHDNLRELAMTPEQLREQLPLPGFMAKTEPSVPMSLPPRADTPPPPPPTIPQFVNYTVQSFEPEHAAANPSTANAEAKPSNLPNWPPSAMTGHPAAFSSMMSNRPVSPASKIQDLPVFTAHGMIRFASEPQTTTLGTGASSASMSGQLVDVKKETEADIWEIPDTPSK